MAHGRSSLSYEEFRATKRFPGLDGIRAISALLVISVHLMDNNLFRRWDWLAGEMGVYVFFVLSGFLITTLALREEEARDRLSLRAFFVRRSFRIFPLYYCVLGMTVLAAYSVNGGQARNMTSALPYYLTYMGEFAPGALFHHSWSLGIEEKFYLAWPLLCFVLFRRARSLRLPMALLIAALPLVFDAAADNRALSGYSKIVAGCALAVALHDERRYRLLALLLDRAGTILPVVVLLALQYAPLGVGSPVWHVLHSLSVAYLILACVAARPVWLPSLESKPMRFVGERSYGIYLIQILVVPIAALPFPAGSGSRVTEFAAYFTTCALCVLAADVLRRTVEMPSLRFGRRISDQILGSGAERRPE